jgi:hypothetical protein
VPAITTQVSRERIVSDEGAQPAEAVPTSRTGDALRILRDVVVVLVLLQLLFFGLLVAAQAVPDGPIVEHLNEAVADGTYGPTGRPDNMGSESTSFDECVAVGTGLGRPDLDPFERAARMPRIGSCSTGPSDLAALARGDEPGHVTEYFRYWSGWSVLSRPVVALWGIEALRRIAGALLVLSAGAFLVVLARRTTRSHAAALALPVLLGSNVLATPSTSLNQSISLAAAFLTPTLVALGTTRGWRATLVAAAVGAAVYNYVDLMLTPAIPWMLATTTTAAVLFVRSGGIGPGLRRAAGVAVVWPFAFAFTWASRWLLAVVLLGWDHSITVIRDKVEFRLGGSSASVDEWLGASTSTNVDYWLTNVSTAWAVAAGAAVVVVGSLLVAWRRFGPSRLGVFAVLAAPACFAPVWYELLRNHSQIHPGKAHTSIPVAIGVVVGAAVLAATDVARRRPGRPERSPAPAHDVEPGHGASVPDATGPAVVGRAAGG